VRIVGWSVSFVLAGCGFNVAAKESRDAAPDRDAPADAPADAFTAADCPLTYSIAHGLSRYAVVSQTTEAWDASARCASDLPGATHLVVFDSPTEQLEIQADINATQSGVNQYWIGAVQRIDATQIGEGWLGLTGGPLGGFWNINEPTDNDGGTLTVEVHAEQFVRLDRNGSGMTDAPGRNPGNGFVCECDGKPIDPVAAKAITDSTGI
jgi:hypothetical protein